MYTDLTHICRIVTSSPLFSCLCELCCAHRSMVAGLREGVKESGFLTPAEIARCNKTREDIRSGKELFQKEDLKEFPAVKEKAQRVVREVSTKEIKKIEKRWKDGIEGNSSRRTFDLSNPDSPAKDWFPKEQSDPVPSDKLFCSFCQREVSAARATLGRGPLRFNKVEQTISVDPRVVISTTKVTSQKLVACPDCCLKIKPKVETYCAVCIQRQADCKCPEFKPKKIAVHSNLRTYDAG